MVDIRFLTAGAAFKDDYVGEVDRILRDIADRISEGANQGMIFCANGNRIGDFKAARQGE